jgi:outer membrane protein assembly factor BamB
MRDYYFHRERRYARRAARYAARWTILCLFAVSRAGGGTAGETGAVPGPAAGATHDGLIASPEPGWPQWRGPRRDAISDEKGLMPAWPEGGPPLIWKADGLGAGWSSPIVAGERLYITGDVGDDLAIFAFDLAGCLLWRARNGRAWKGSYPGARACCAYSEGRLYHLNAHGRLACLDAATGREQWAADIQDRFGAETLTWGASECLLVDGPRVIVTPGGTKALMAALDKRTGETVWTVGRLGDDFGAYASPILFRFGGRRILAACSSDHGFGVDADGGRLLWTVPLRNQYQVNSATPVYGNGHVFFVTPYTDKGRCYRLRADDAGVSAERVWSSPIDSGPGTAVLAGDLLLAAGYRPPKWWFGVDWRTGRTRHERRDLTTGSAVYADGRLYVQDECGTVALLKPGPEALDVAGRFRLPDRRESDAWAHPVLCGGRLYLRYHDALWCHDVKAR